MKRAEQKARAIDQIFKISILNNRGRIRVRQNFYEQVNNGQDRK